MFEGTMAANAGGENLAPAFAPARPLQACAAQPQPKGMRKPASQVFGGRVAPDHGLREAGGRGYRSSINPTLSAPSMRVLQAVASRSIEASWKPARECCVF
jgi:hypothetical protein